MICSSGGVFISLPSGLLPWPAQSCPFDQTRQPDWFGAQVWIVVPEHCDWPAVHRSTQLPLHASVAGSHVSPIRLQSVVSAQARHPLDR